jgi:hypothetical protein
MQRFRALIRAGVILAFCSTIYGGVINAQSVQPTIPVSFSTIQKMNRMPSGFTKNVGQWDERVLYRANSGGATMWFTKEGITYQFTRDIGGENLDSRKVPLYEPAGTRSLPLHEGLDSRFRGNDKGVGNDVGKDRIEQMMVTSTFVGANPNLEIVGEDQMEHQCNYFIGSDPTKWHTNVPNFSAIVLKDIYPGIDLRYSNGIPSRAGQITYELIAAPGVDITQVKIAYGGAEEVSLDPDGKLILRTKWGDITAAIPASTSSDSSGITRFSQLSGKTIGFQGLDSSRQALGNITVALSYSTYLGGGNNEKAFGIAVDGSGCAYVTGRTESSDFPTLNPFQMDQGYDDVFVTKLSGTGSMIYSTYLGGGGRDWGSGIAVDGGGNAYITGWTDSPNFPTLNPYQGTNQGSSDAFVTKLSSTGSNLIYSTYLGGGNDEWGYGIAIGGSGSSYVTGYTYSLDFPTLNSFQSTNHGSPDVFVTKLSGAGSSLIYSTFLGGEGNDCGNGIAVDGNGSAFVTGYTYSFDFPTVSPYQTWQGGGQYGWDVFVTKISNAGNSLIYSTFLGGSEDDYGYAIAVDGSGSAYVTGWTRSSDFPTSNPFRGSFEEGDIDAFVTKLFSSGDSLVYSTFLGGSDNDHGYGVAVDAGGNASVTGNTGSSNFPTANPYQTSGGIFATKFSTTGSDLTHSTYLGEAGDYGYGIALDDDGVAYVTGWTSSNNFPSGLDAFVTKLNKRQCLCGDTDGDGLVNVMDVVFLINYVLMGGVTPEPLEAGDINCDQRVNISDVVYLNEYIFSGGSAPCEGC